MATAVRGGVPQSGVVHVFEQLTMNLEKLCELCYEQPAIFLWTEQRDGKLPQGRELAICRICAGMVLLTVKDS
jgi:hypothetical protein